MANGEYLLEMKNVSKSFPGVQALKDVRLNVKAGEVHALMGENGAGKSTLMKCLFGIYKMDEGEIVFQGEPILIRHLKPVLLWYSRNWSKYPSVVLWITYGLGDTLKREYSLMIKRCTRIH